MINIDILIPLALVALAAIIHASFQLSVSVLTLLSGHALGRKTAHMRLLRLAGGFIAGAGVMTLLLLSTSAYTLSILLPLHTPMVIWAIAAGAVIGLGVSVWMFYYRGHKGTSLWIPRGFADYLSGRAKSSKAASETFGLGLTSVMAELLFIFAPVLVASLILIRLSPELQLAGIVLYTAISLLPLLIVGSLIGGGHKLRVIQRWRETNKRFLQFAAGSGLFILGTYVYVEYVIVTGTVALGSNL